MVVLSSDTGYEVFVAVPFFLALIIGAVIVVWFVRAARRDREEEKRARTGDD